MFNVVLFQPEIAPNTGNIMRLCANTGCWLHLIRPLGFTLDERRLRRAGLDYREWVTVKVYDGLDDYLTQANPLRLFAFSTKATRHYTGLIYTANDSLLFGPETQGLPSPLLKHLGPERVLRLPMVANSRSLNLSNAVAVVVYEAWRQLGFARGS